MSLSFGTARDIWHSFSGENRARVLIIWHRQTWHKNDRIKIHYHVQELVGENSQALITSRLFNEQNISAPKGLSSVAKEGIKTDQWWLWSVWWSVSFVAHFATEEGPFVAEMFLLIEMPTMWLTLDSPPQPTWHKDVVTKSLGHTRPQFTQAQYSGTPPCRPQEKQAPPW